MKLYRSSQFSSTVVLLWKVNCLDEDESWFVLWTLDSGLSAVTLVLPENVHPRGVSTAQGVYFGPLITLV